MGRELLVTVAVLLGVFVIGQPYAKLGELTRPEIGTVAATAALLALTMFVGAVWLVRRREHYMRAVVWGAFAMFMIAGVLTERFRGPACLSDEIDDPSLCRRPPAEVVDWGAWWQGWYAARGLMMMSGSLGAVAGALVALRWHRPLVSGAEPIAAGRTE